MATRIVVMKDGVIQQVGEPKEIYDFPKNVFVAGFIGSPAMNFFKGKIEKGSFVTAGVKLKIPDAKLKRLANLGYLDKVIILGIRPENIYVKQAKATPGSIINAKIEVAELMGAETMLYSSLGDTTYLARVDASIHVKVDQTFPLMFDMEKCHFFDNNSEERISFKQNYRQLELEKSI